MEKIHAHVLGGVEVMSAEGVCTAVVLQLRSGFCGDWGCQRWIGMLPACTYMHVCMVALGYSFLECTPSSFSPIGACVLYTACSTAVVAVTAGWF